MLSRALRPRFLRITIPMQRYKSTVTHNSEQTRNALVNSPELISRGELAWCEVYGVDYYKQMAEAQADKPIALNAPQQSTNPSNSHPSSHYQSEIWSVVFGR